MNTRIRVATVVVLFVTSCAIYPAAHGVTTNWTDSGGGPFTDIANWDNGVPGDGDDAVFNLNGTYTVDFTGDVESDSVQLLDGRATFFSSNATPPTYTLDPASSF